MSTQENKKFNISLSLEELNLVLGQLAEAPAKISMGLIIGIQQQAHAQDSGEPSERHMAQLNNHMAQDSSEEKTITLEE